RRRGHPPEGGHCHHDLAGEQESVGERLLIGPNPEDRRDDQALGCPGTIFAKRHIREAGRSQEPVQCLLEGLMIRHRSGKTIRVLMRHARLLRVVESHGFCCPTETVTTTSCRIKTFSLSQKKG